jgi:predicted phosphate transport protein (TIGR00153 family)
MQALAALFGKSPFQPLQLHMEKARACVKRMRPFFAAVLDGDDEKQARLVEQICRLESEADVIKNDIRNHLPKSMFLPVDRRDLLEILANQESLADTAEDIAVTLTLRKMSFHPELEAPLEELLGGVTKVCFLAADIIQRLDELVETSFGGPEAEKVSEMIDRLNVEETITDDIGARIARKLFALESELGPICVMLWFRVFRQLGELATIAERLGNQLRLLLAQ